MKTESQQMRTLQKSANDSTTCSSKTMERSKNVTTKAATAGKPNLQLPVSNSNLQSIDKPLAKQTVTQPSVERADDKVASQGLTSGRVNNFKSLPRDEDSILGQQFKRF